MAASSYQKDGRLAPAKLTVAADTATISGSSNARGGVATRRLRYPLSTSPWCQKCGRLRGWLCYRPVLVPEMNRRNVMLTFGIGALAAAIPTSKAQAKPRLPAPAPTAPAPGAQAGGYLSHDEFDGPAGSAPDPSKWVVSANRTRIKNPVGFDRPEFLGPVPQQPGERLHRRQFQPGSACHQRRQQILRRPGQRKLARRDRHDLGSPHQTQLPHRRGVAGLVAVQRFSRS